MNHLRNCLFVFLLAVAPALAGAEAYFVAPVRGEGLDPALLKTVQRLVAVSVSENGRTASEDEASAAWTLKAELIKLGESYIVSLVKVQANGTAIAFADKQKAAGTGELDGAVSRLVKDAVAGKPSEAKPAPAQAEAAAEAASKQALADRKTTYFGFGPMRFNGLNTPANDPFGYYLATGMRLDVNDHAAMTLIGESSFNVRDDGRGSVVGALLLGGEYFFSGGDVSPFLGIDLGYGGAGGADVRSVFGFAGGARVGLMFFRSSSVQLSLALRHLTIFENNGNGVPGHSGLVVGANF